METLNFPDTDWRGGLAMRCAQKNPAYHTIYGVSRAIVHKSDIRVTFKCNALVRKLMPKDVPSDSA